MLDSQKSIECYQKDGSEKNGVREQITGPRNVVHVSPNVKYSPGCRSERRINGKTP